MTSALRIQINLPTDYTFSFSRVKGQLETGGGWVFKQMYRVGGIRHIKARIGSAQPRAQSDYKLL